MSLLFVQANMEEMRYHTRFYVFLFLLARIERWDDSFDIGNEYPGWRL
jgi:hypothetical protein